MHQLVHLKCRRFPVCQLHLDKAVVCFFLKNKKDSDGSFLLHARDMPGSIPRVLHFVNPLGDSVILSVPIRWPLFLQMRKLKPREVKMLGPGHTASSMAEPGSELGQAGVTVHIFNYAVDLCG